MQKKGQKKLVKKLVHLLVKKFMISFHLKIKSLTKTETEKIPQEPIFTEETKGKEISQILKKQRLPKEDKYQYIKDIYNDLILKKLYNRIIKK